MRRPQHLIADNAPHAFEPIGRALDQTRGYFGGGLQHVLDSLRMLLKQLHSGIRLGDIRPPTRLTDVAAKPGIFGALGRPAVPAVIQKHERINTSRHATVRRLFAAHRLHLPICLPVKIRLESADPDSLAHNT